MKEFNKMEQMDINKVGQEVIALRKIVEEVKNLLLEEDLEVSDEVVLEIKNSRKIPKEELISHKDVMAEFQDD